MILIFALAFEVLEEYRDTRKFNSLWLWLAMIPAGFGVYLLLNYLVTGSPTTFLVYQHEHWQRYVRVPWEGIYESWKRIFNPKIVDAQLYGIQEMLFVVIGLAATIVGFPITELSLGCGFRQSAAAAMSEAAWRSSHCCIRSPTFHIRAWC